MRTNERTIFAVAGSLYAALVFFEGAAGARPLWVKKAKEAGFPAENCQYCHTVKLPKKESFKPDELNDRGKWLLAEKTNRKAAEVDLAWLKDYPGGAAQK